MMDLNFNDRLTTNVFTYGNDYQYWIPNESGSDGDSFPYYFTENDENKPFIMTSGLHIENNRLSYSTIPQFGHRVIIAKRAKEIFNTAKMPLKIAIRNNFYLIGKGFLAKLIGDVPIILFMACYSGNTPTSVDQIKLIVSKQVYLPAHAYLLPMITEEIKNHIGDVFIVRDITKYIGHTIKFPNLGTVREKLKFNEEVLKHCITREKVNLGIAV